MSRNQVTGGEWVPVYHHGSATVTSKRGICICVAPSLVDQREWVRSADARLIAAAPDMYAALKALEGYAQEQVNDWAADAQEGGRPDAKALQMWSGVQAATAKAEGSAS